MTQQKDFPLEQVLSATSGFMLVDDVSQVHAFFAWLFDASFNSFQILNVRQQARQVLAEQHAWLKQIDLNSITPDNWQQQITQLKAKYGATVLVTQRPNITFPDSDAALLEALAPALEPTHQYVKLEPDQCRYVVDGVAYELPGFSNLKPVSVFDEWGSPIEITVNKSTIFFKSPDRDDQYTKVLGRHWPPVGGINWTCFADNMTGEQRQLTGLQFYLLIAEIGFECMYRWEAPIGDCITGLGGN